MTVGTEQSRDLKILSSALAAGVLPEQITTSLIAKLKSRPEYFSLLLAATEALEKPGLKRALNIAKLQPDREEFPLKFDFQDGNVFFLEYLAGKAKLLFKPILPGELQARLAIESTVDRFLDFLKKKYFIVVLDETDRHVLLFVPNTSELENLDFDSLWNDFVANVLFSSHGIARFQIPGLMQSFVAMLKSITLSGRGFSILEVPIITRDQANVLAAWYFAVWREAKKRQSDRKRKINSLSASLENTSLSEKDVKAVTKQLQDAEAMQAKEDKKYQENFHKFFGEIIKGHKKIYGELADIESRLKSEASKSEIKKLVKQKGKFESEIVFSQGLIERQSTLYEQSRSDPFLFVERDLENNPEQFSEIIKIAGSFNKTATDQIAGVKGDIFIKCIVEMYRLMEMTDTQIDSSITPLLTEKPLFQSRSPGDDNKEFCYSCGAKLDSKAAEWQVRRLVFESPEQRRQSATGKGRPHICKSCAVLAFASPLKLTGESIIVKLEASSGSESIKLKLQDYLRMLASKELHLSAGKYIALASEKTQGDDSASQRLGQVQYAIAKVADTFPVEVLTDFCFSLMTQGGEAIRLTSRHLIFIKGLIDNYGQKILISGQDVNFNLGKAIRYIQQDLPILAEYETVKSAPIMKIFPMENIRELYFKIMQEDLEEERGDSMNSKNQHEEKFDLYRDVAALTGLMYAFVNSTKRAVRQEVAAGNMKEEEANRNVEKLIEQVVVGANEFCYYAARYNAKKQDNLGNKSQSHDQDKKVRASLKRTFDHHFIYDQAKVLLDKLGFSDREKEDDNQQPYLLFNIDDVSKAYDYFRNSDDGYFQDRKWRDLLYQVKLSLYSRFPELIRKS